MKVNLAETILKNIGHYRSDHDKLAGAVMNAKLGMDRTIAVQLDTNVSLGRDQFIQQLTEFLITPTSTTKKILGFVVLILTTMRFLLWLS